MNPMFETVQADTDSSLRCLRFSCRHFSDDHTWHYHPEYELACVLSSAGTRFVGDSIQPYSAGDMVLLGPNLPHCWSDEPALDGADVLPELIVIQFDQSSFGAGFLALAETAPIRRLLALAETGLSFSGRTTLLAGELMRKAVEQEGLHRLLRLIEALSALTRCEHVDALATPAYRSTADMNPASRDRIEFVHRHVREHLADDISQARLARTLGLSPPAFSRFFKAATGKTFIAFVNTLRINEACRRLNDPAVPITEIAMACGYNNVSNFNRQFLALKGMSPSSYRRRAERKLQHHARYTGQHAPRPA